MSADRPNPRHVFLNCPFDSEYRALLKALLFTVLDCGWIPRIAAEQVDSGQVRIEKIRGMISSCRLSIHDISRMEPLREGELPRFNMPFELGLDLGCRFYGSKAFGRKECLILEKEPHRYKQVLSDISGHDIRAHGGSPQRLVTEVRQWLSRRVRRHLPSESGVWVR